MNKGVTVADNRALLAALRGWAEHPAFDLSGASFGFILFTPWTTMADLRAAYDGIVATDFDRLRGRLLTARVRLYPDTALYYLAAKDGLLADDGASPQPGRYGYYPDRAWRFADPVVGHFAELAAAVTDATDGRDQRRVFRTLLDAFAAAPEPQRHHAGADPGRPGRAAADARPAGAAAAGRSSPHPRARAGAAAAVPCGVCAARRRRRADRVDPRRRRRSRRRARRWRRSRAGRRRGGGGAGRWCRRDRGGRPRRGPGRSRRRRGPGRPPASTRSRWCRSSATRPSSTIAPSAADGALVATLVACARPGRRRRGDRARRYRSCGARLQDLGAVLELFARAVPSLAAVRLRLPRHAVPRALAPPPLDELAPRLEAALAVAERLGVRAPLDVIAALPLCAVVPSPRAQAAVRFDPRRPTHVSGCTQPAACAGCAVASACPGVPAPYLAAHGVRGVRPLEIRPAALFAQRTTPLRVWDDRARDAARQAGILVLRPTVHCNQDCGFCSANESTPNVWADPAQMMRAIARAARRGVNRVSFSGGEPTLARELPSYIRVARRAGVPKVELVTNGVLLDRAPARAGPRRRRPHPRVRVAARPRRGQRQPRHPQAR
jgi:uncharacterized radical SAM superfamily Fe-S cluster-containing enzyme